MDKVFIINIVLVFILVIGVIDGYRKGLMRQVFGLAGLIVSFIVALLLAGGFATFLSENTQIPYSPALIFAFIGIFVVGLVGFHYLSLAVERIIRMTILGWLDRLGGAALGLVIAMLIASLLISIVLELPLSKETRFDFERSSVSNFLKPVAPRIFDFVFKHGSKRIHYHAFFKENSSA